MGDLDQSPNYQHVVPTTQIKTSEGVAVWEDSEAYQEYLGFIIAIGESVKGRKITEEITMSCCCRRLVDLLTILRKNIGETPACEMQSRYGNPAYRDWFAKLESSADTLVADLLCGAGDELGGAAVELVPYLVDSFGNKTRIDYGTGHEMTFVMFLCGIFKIGALKESDRAAVGLKVFAAYMALCRDLQATYRMEPAGSMGVWNLDDYQFVSFIWGAAQLCEKARIKPKSISDPEMAEMLCKENHFFACLAYIHKVKTGPFHEHSNQLWNISGVPMWSKVFTGLIKMYRAEVLCKFPVVQHTLFGSIFTLKKAEFKNPVIPVADVQVERPGIPGVDSPRPGTGTVSRFPRPAIPGIGLPPAVPGLTMQDVRIPPTACPMPGARVPGSVIMPQFPGPGNPTQFPGSCPISRLPTPDFQTPIPSVSVTGDSDRYTMSNFEEQMRLFEAEVGQGLRPPAGGSHPPPKPAFMPASVRTHQGGGGPPPPPTFSRPGLVKSFTPVQKQYSAPANISKPSEEEDVFSTLLKYEKEVRAEKKEKKQFEKEKKKVKKDKKEPSKAVVAAAPPQPTMFKPSHISAQPTAAVVIKPGTQVTPDEIKLKAKQMVELVKATQVIQTKRLPPTQSTSKLTEVREHKSKKPKKMIRVAGGQVWEDTSLLNWDINDFRLFCGDLGNDVTDEVLTRTFSRYPSFQMAKVVRDKRSNKTKGYGFVSFKDPMDFTKAIKEMDGKYVGSRPIKLRKSNWKDRNVDVVKGKQKLKQQMGYKY